MSRPSEEALFVGRATELRELDVALSAARSGRGSCVCVTGEPGIGKSSLCSRFAQYARQRGARVLTGRAWEWGGAPPFWLWSPVVRALGGSDRQPSLFGGTPSPDPDTLTSTEFTASSGEQRFALFAAVTEQLRQAALSDPLLVLLEDLHAADLPSLLLLRFSVEQLHDVAVLFVATWRSVESAPAAEAAALWADIGRVARSIELRGWSPAEVQEFRERLGRVDGDEPAVSAALHERTAGNPLFVTSLLQSGGLEAPDGSVPLRARSAIERRLGRLDAPARAVLSAAAVVGRDLAVLLLARVSGLALEQVLGAVHELGAERILTEKSCAPGRYGFCHGLFREVVYAALPPAERLRLHRAAGTALEELYGSERQSHLPELARHFLAVTPDPLRGFEYALAAGEHALRSVAHEAAIGHFRDALSALAGGAADARLRAGVWLKLATAQALCGAAAEARQSYATARRLALESSDPALAAQAVIGVARVAGYGRVDDEAVAWLEQSLEAEHDDATRVRLLCSLVDRIWMYPDDRGLELRLQQALALAERSGDPHLLALALTASLASLQVPDARRFAECRRRADQLHQLAQRLGDAELRVEACRWRFTTSMIAGEIEAAKRALDSYEQLAAELARPQLEFNARLRRMMLACMEGRFDDARQLLPAAERAARRAGDPQAPFLLGSFQLKLRRAEGDRSALAAIADRLEQRIGNDLSSVARVALQARLASELGRQEPARAALEEYFELAPNFAAGGGPLALAATTWAVWQLGDSDRARQLLPLLEPCEGLVLMAGAIDFLGPGSFFLGLACATAGLEARAAVHLERALADLGRMGARVLEAEARAILCGLARSTAPPAAPRGDRLPAAAPSAGGLFAPAPGGYLVGLAGKTAQLRCSKGLSLIEQLLRQEGTELHVLELAGSALADAGNGAPLLDARAKAEYRTRLQELATELVEAEANADLGRQERALAEQEALLTALARATGLGGRDRSTGPAERARARVTLAIRRAIKGLSGAHPALAAHLQTAIVTGTFCVYRPDPRARVDWSFEPPSGAERVVKGAASSPTVDS